MNIKYLLPFVVLFTMFSCTKENNQNFDKQNETDILKYIEDHNLDAQKSESGLYYVINKQGDGLKPSITTNVIVSYNGYYLDGRIFDKSDEFGIAFNLQQVILGWSEGITYFNEGGEGILLIPSRLAYGNTDYNGIPAGSVLVFEIKLISTEEGIDAVNDKEISNYIQANSLDAKKSETGLYYVINKQGDGAKPDENSAVTVAYKGYFINGTTFDESIEEGIDFELKNLIPGFKEGITYFNEGGEGTLFIPSSLSYGFFGIGGIPAGAVTIFDIKLIDVKE
jgi:FKBP-type peptidyl-prolyl cis-trans isomerase